MEAKTHPLIEAAEEALSYDLVTRTHLFNHGLHDPGCVIAYRAVMSAGAGAEAAWEAARSHELLSQLRLIRDLVASVSRMSATDLHLSGRGQRVREQTARRREQMAKTAAMPNPFAVAEPVALERAA